MKDINKLMLGAIQPDKLKENTMEDKTLKIKITQTIEPKTDEEILNNFKQELLSLLDKYNAQLGATYYCSVIGRIKGSKKYFELDESC